MSNSFIPVSQDISVVLICSQDKRQSEITSREKDSFLRRNQTGIEKGLQVFLMLIKLYS